MPRPLRLEYENAWYHVMNRGAGYKNIYLKLKHRKIFLDVLGETSKLFNIEIHAYCLMDNHYHLLIKTPFANLSRAMRHINGVYTQRFNRDMKRDGSLFRGRYKAIIVDKDSYLLQVSRYVHLNPLEAKIVKQLEKYKWSSYPSYINQADKPTWLYHEEILSAIGGNNPRKQYKNFVQMGADEETQLFYGKKNLSIIFGPRQFKKKLLKNVDTKKRKSSSPDYKRTVELPSLQQIAQACAKHFNVEEKSLYKSKRGKNNDPRKVAMYCCRLWTMAPLNQIILKFNCQSHSSIANVVLEMNKRMQTDSKLQNALNEIKEKIYY